MGMPYFFEPNGEEVILNEGCDKLFKLVSANGNAVFIRANGNAVFLSPGF